LASGRRNSFSGESSHPSQSKLAVGPNSHQRSATIHSGNLARATHRYTSSTPAPQQLSHIALSREEADLERAIALSLQESAASQLQRASFPHAISAPSHQSYHVTPSRPPTSTREDETDEPELAAAIAASLREAQLASNPHPSAPSPSRSLETLPSRPVSALTSANTALDIRFWLNFCILS
jgi:growth factor-regulated tyrosine kinase substrate